MRSTIGKIMALLCAALLAGTVILPACAEEGEAAEEQGVQEIQQLLEVSEVENTEGLGLEELTEAFSEQAMSDYLDSRTGFSMQYPSSFQFDEERETMTAFTGDGKASLTIENMQGKLTEEMLREAIKLEVPDAEPQQYENHCLRVDRVTGDGTRCRTDLYLAAKDSFHHVILEYPAEEQETWGTYIDYMVNTMATKESEQG